MKTTQKLFLLTAINILAAITLGCSVESIEPEVNSQREVESNYRMLCSGNGYLVITNDILWKINGEVVTQQQANDKCKEING